VLKYYYKPTYFLLLKNVMTEEQIRHLARLSEIELTDEDVENMKKEFNSLLDFVWKLQEIPTDWVEKMYTPIENVFLDYERKTDTSVDKEQVLKNSPHEVENNMIVIKSSTVEH